MKTLQRRLTPYHLICLCLCAVGQQGHALPALPSIEQGSASVSVAGSQMDIHQYSDLLVTRHQGYDLAAGEAVHYLQPSSSSLAIAKIDGGMSHILGQISANGRLWLINPDGFLVGQGASIDAAGLMLASHNLQQDGAGFRLQQGPGSITNLGSITVAGDGQLTLLSRSVDNQGMLSSGGDLLINTGERLLLQAKGQGFAIEVEQNGTQGLITNRGDMQGQHVELNADQDTRSAAITINNTGSIRAVAVLEQDGEIYLSARGGSLAQDGTVQAAAGLIDIQADTYLQQGLLDVSAAQGDGGTVNLWAEAGFELSGSSRSLADGAQRGNGGSLNFISPGYGISHSGAWLSARGGQLAGDGGFAEISGWQFVQNAGLVDLRAPKGQAGTLLIDPYNIEIIAGSVDSNTSFGGGSYTASNTPAQIGANNITTQLGLGNVVINTTGAGAEAGDITVTGAVTLDGSSGRSLTLQADGSININNDLINASDSTNVTLTAGGNIIFSAGSNLDVGSGTISLTAGGSTQVRSGSLQTTSSSNTAISITTNGNLTGSTDDSADIIAQNGGISITAGSMSSLELDVAKASLTSTSGGISVKEKDDLNLTALTLPANQPLGILGYNSGNIGTLTLPNAGITVSGALSLYATDIIDGDGGDVIINNSSASGIILAAPAAARSFDIGTGSTSFTVGNSQNLNVQNSSGALQLGASMGTGNLTLSSNGNMQISSLSGAGSLSATATGSISIPDAGLSATSSITLNGTDIIDSDRSITLNASALDITTTLAAGDSTISTTATSLAAYKGAVTTDLLTINKSNAGNLTVSTIDTGSGDLTLNLSNGDLIVSDTHLQSTGTMTVVANDIHDSDRIVTLNGTQLDITLNGTNINGLTLRGLANTNVAMAGTSATDLTLLSDSGSFTVTSMVNWAGDLTLDAASRITVPNAGISCDGTLTVNAGYVRSVASGTSATLNGGFGLVLDLGLGNGSATVNTTSLFGTISTTGTSNTLTLNKTNAGDFDLGNASISGGLTIALNNGTLTLPASITVPGTLTVNANDLNDASINGGSLDLSLDALADGLNLTTALNSAVINITGAAQSFALTESDDLTLSSFASSGDVNISSGGALTIADTGLNSSANLTLDVGDIHDSDRSVILNGNTGFTLSTDLSGGNSTINTTNSSAAITTTSANTLTLNKSNAGDFTLSSASIAAGSLNIALNNGNLTLPATLTVPGTLTINAHDLNDITLNGGSLDLNLDALADGLNLTTALNSASINITGAAQAFNLNETNALTLSSLSSTGDVSISSTGVLTASGTLGSAGLLTINSAGLGSDLTINSADFLLTDSGNNQTRNISSSAQNNDVNFSGSNNTLTLNIAANGHLSDLNSDNLALNIVDGHATLNFAGAGFIDSALQIADASNDVIRHGWLNILYAGALDINANIDVLSTFESNTNTLPQDSSNSYAGLFVLENQGSGILTLAPGTQITSTGGDIVLDILGTQGNYAALVMGAGSSITALTAPADTSTAIDSAAPYASQLLAANGRNLYLLPDANNPPITPDPDISDIIDDALSGAEETQIQDQAPGNSAAENIISSTQESLDNNPNISFAMEAIFNRCTRQNADKCELKKELSRFLGQYLIGGSMPKAKR